MLYFNFKNYEEFKAMFGKRVGNNGKLIRSNHILLAYYKHEFKCGRFPNLKSITSIDELYNWLLSRLGWNNKLSNGIKFYHPEYELDVCNGVCEDGDSRCIRYFKSDGRVFKMKAGKFMRKLLEYNEIAKHNCEQVVIYVCERFAEEWKSHVESNYGDKYVLHVNDDFYKIYDYSYCRNGFNSCMMNDCQYEFYEKAVKAKAAYLEDSNGHIVARCVIFTEVHDDNTGETFRLAERQYAANEDNVLKQILVDKLIKGGHIDGYKRVGADCHNKRAFLFNNGESMMSRELSIECNLELDDIISYQDSFKHFNYSYQTADNYSYDGYDLATTDQTLNGDRVYDSYHEYYCNEVEDVYMWNEHRGYYYQETCDVEVLRDEFLYCERNDRYYDEAEWSEYEQDYIPKDEAEYCEYLHDWLWNDRTTYSDEMEDHLPDYEYDEILLKWKEENWEWDEYNEEFVKETISCMIWDSYYYEYKEKNVGKDYAEQYFFLVEGVWYSELDEYGMPYTIEEECECESV